MTKEILDCYKYLDLPLDATIYDIQAREKAMIKVLRAKGIRGGVSYSNHIEKITYSADTIIKNIRDNGIQKTTKHFFTTNLDGLLTELFLMIIIGIVCGVSFLSLLVL